MKEHSVNQTGEITGEDSFHYQVIAWKIPELKSLPLKENEAVQSPSFHCEDASSWNLKIFVRGQTNLSSECRVDVVLERLRRSFQSDVISYKMFFTEYDENTSFFDYMGKAYFTDTLGKSLYPTVKGSFRFKSNCNQVQITNVLSYSRLLELSASNPTSDSVVLVCEFQAEVRSKIRSVIQANTGN